MSSLKAQKKTFTLTILHTPCHGLQHKVQIMAETEPLNEDGSPHIAKLKKVVQLKMEDKMV